VALIPFTQEIAQKDALTFLKEIHDCLPFESLVLGHDARLGRGREGTPEQILKIASTLSFKVEYLSAVLLDGQIVSSSRIRKYVTQGELDKAAALLNRPLSYRAVVAHGPMLGRKLGYPTANLPVEGLCLPPYGIYAVTLKIENRLLPGVDRLLPGVANLGVAPTLQERKAPLLEVHLIDHQEDLYDVEVEVALHQFLRSEQRFASFEALQHQIALDIEKARLVLANLNSLKL
jgi:riboflavin kinase/FMN adenylyltransferase